MAIDMVAIPDTKAAAIYLVDTVRAGKTLLGEHPTIAPKEMFSAAGYTARVFDIWTVTPFGTYVKGTYYMFFKRKYYETFGRNHNFKSEPLGMSISLIPLKEAAKQPDGHVIVVMENGEIWVKRAKEWLSWCNEYENRGVIRKMKAYNNGEHLEASIGLSQLTKVFPLA